MLLGACASSRAPRALVPVRAEALAQMAPWVGRPPAAAGPFVADGRLTHFGDGGRLRAQVQLLVRAPDQFRAAVLTPQGPPALVVACDGRRLTSLDVMRSHYGEAEATAAGLRTLAPAIDLALAPAWLPKLLSGTLRPGPNATFAADGAVLQASWCEAGTAWEGQWRRDDGRLLRLQGRVQGTRPTASVDAVDATDAPGRSPVGEAGPGADTTLDVQLRGHDAAGLPSELVVDVRGGAAGKGHAVALVLGERRYDVQVADGAFSVRP